ncbi:unknown protein, putative [Entamoeba histolytica HM-1:IMSS-A]|uniref:Uncharacterized protein n=1 Tax=Entamoeba histolytica HM-1:IMSS-A TaxID=885318 RepID=N9V5S1_ENTH1|nr:unknown protein, putative [Entamoeba histolytica HM-1:IMSS-A]
MIHFIYFFYCLSSLFLFVYFIIIKVSSIFHLLLTSSFIFLIHFLLFHFSFLKSCIIHIIIKLKYHNQLLFVY